ncbi:MAG: DinB family protein [Chloroflexi bacterium]|nr:DinB family protein [Chloroflexota bacterium]MDA1271918.1 DinB family protein [Chloroflexota bacterium]PKB58906.1 MAG: hypothetical protein BZY83_04635 [SAR202 cluster bacterium Casp-Chloro-G2]
MSANHTTVSALERNWEMVTSAVSEVDDATMAIRPNDDSNSMSWLVWHMARVADRFIHFRLMEKPQIWTADAWHSKFKMDADPQDFGMGWTNEQAAAWQAPPKGILMGYFDRVNTAVADYLRNMPEAELEREIQWTLPTGVMPVKEALSILVWDNIVHGGQVAYLRGYFRGGGWHR